MKLLGVVHGNFTRVSQRNQFGSAVTIATHPQVIRYQQRLSFCCFQEAIAYGHLLAVPAELLPFGGFGRVLQHPSCVRRITNAGYPLLNLLPL
jgi:hypothetical protein